MVVLILLDIASKSVYKTCIKMKVKVKVCIQYALKVGPK